MRFSTSVFFINQCPPSLWVSHLDRFKFFRKFAEIIANECLSVVSTTPAINEKNFEVYMFFTLLSALYTHWLNFCLFFISRCSKLQYWQHCLIAGVKDIGEFFSPFTPLINIHLRLSQLIFEKSRNNLMGYSGARGTLIHEKKNWSRKSSVRSL
jgi:hypothetical protein